ncbi:MAG TPA: hypothetical protein VFQ39_12075, partial [Longimicrobium sp.]|nr:hypothetical protein [Longimicrobium sp.]
MSPTRQACRFCGNQVAAGMLRCPFCGISQPHGRGTGPSTKKPDFPAPVSPLAPTLADPDPAAEAEPFVPPPPRERLHGLRGRVVMTGLWMVGAFLAIKGCASWGTPDGTSAGMDALIMAAGIGLIWTSSAIRGWRRVGMHVALALITLVAGTLLVDFMPFLTGGGDPVRWGPSLWTIGVAALFAQYFLSRDKLFGTADPVLDAYAPPPFREEKHVKAGGGRTSQQAARMNAIIAINNAIAREKSPKNTSIETVRAIPREFGHTLGSLDAERKALYRAYLQHYLGNG